MKVLEKIKTKLKEENYQKLEKLNNTYLFQFINDFIELCNPDSVFVSCGSPEDIKYIREEAVRNGEEERLAIEGHSVHIDGFNDQARDKQNTRLLVPKGIDLGSNMNSIDREKGIEEIHTILKNIMQDHTMYILFFCLGPTGGMFSIPCVQITDSSYVAHSENLLYRQGYEEFKRLGGANSFFKFVHSEGELEGTVSKNIDRRRVYIDTQENTVYSTNTQYGGNTIGLKKLAMRLSINLAAKEDWLTEHMLVMGIGGPGGRRTYFTGAYPSLCGKTSTAMMEGESIVGDDIAFLRKKGEEVRAVNVEKGMFGIIQGVNSKDDPIIWKALHKPGEIIFSNVLVTDERSVYWIGKDKNPPKGGKNYSGEWTQDKKDTKGNIVHPSHPNARFTISISLLENKDPLLDDPSGVVVRGIVYGGRDSDTWVPVEESFDWIHGVITKAAALESETTAATLGKEGVRKFNPMSNLDFLSIPIGKYIESYMKFGTNLKNPPAIFSVNYFLKDKKGDFLNQRVDKKVWFKWMELRAHKEVEALKTPTGLIPKYNDLKRLFKEALGKDYSEEEYIKQFSLRIPENLSKIDRIVDIYKTKVPDTPQVLFKILKEQKQRLEKAKEEFGDYVSPADFSSRLEI